MVCYRVAACMTLLSAWLGLPEGSSAGSNAGATARMYWQRSGGIGLPGRNSTDTIPQLVVTIKGLKRFQGADVELTVNGVSPLGVVRAVPPAWQAQPGGCRHWYPRLMHELPQAFPRVQTRQQARGAWPLESPSCAPGAGIGPPLLGPEYSLRTI